MAEFANVVTLVVLFSPLFAGIVFKHNHSNDVVLEGVSVDEALLNLSHERVGLLELLGGDVLTLGQFENVFGTVNNLESSVRIQDAHISRAEPLRVIFLESLFSLFRVLVVALGDTGSPHLNFTSRVRLIAG